MQESSPRVWKCASLEWVPSQVLPFDRRGYNIGIRLIDEFLAKSKTGKCVDFRDTADKIAKV